MPTTLTFRRGTTTQNNNFTGAAGEITVDTTTKTLRVHDNSTAGGEGVVGLTATQTLTNKTLTSPTINGGTFSGTFTGTISPGQVTTNSIVSNGSNADISIQPSGTGDVLLSALRVNGTTLDSSDSTKITIAENVDVTGTLAVAGALSSATSLALASGATVTGIADEDNMSSNSATLLATQQSVKAYVDTEIGNISTTSIVQNDSNITVADSGSGTITVTVDGSTIGTFNASGLQLGGSGARVTTVLDEDNFSTNSDTSLATQQSIKAYVDTQITAEDLDFQADSGGALSIDLDSETMTFTGGTGIDTSGSGNAVTFAIDSTVTTLTGSQTLTNKVLTAPTISAPTITGTATIGAVTTNTISSNGSNADLSIQPSGTGDVLISALRVNGTTLDSSDSTKITIAEALDVTGALTFSGFTLPTSDGTDGQALVTDGSKTLSFGTVGSAPASDDSAASVINDKMIRSTARTIDSFHTTFQDSVLYYVVSNDFNEDAINVQKVSVCHNDSASFISSAGAQSKASTTMTAFTTSVDNSVVRVKAASSNAAGGSLSFYKFGLGDNTSTGTSNNVIISQNADVDSASESLVTFAHADFRGAKLFISINNSSKTEVGNTEALVVHDGTDAFISQFGGIQSGDNPLLTLTAAISGSNVVVSAAGLETNLRVTIHAIMLKDTMTSNDGTYSNAEAIAPVTISSSATAVDELVETTANGAVYYLVSKNASEGEFAVNEVFFAMGGGDITVASGPFVSTKGTNQLNFTADYKEDVENTGRLLASSTSGGSTTVSAYRINALAK
tara:strand:- start:201 stop:2573 length:2373 start_codon:yes stop_codon:yes gene_type:complete